MRLVGSPLRYPGGKSRALEQITARLPAAFSEYREPFVGGGSLFIRLRQTRPALPVWINDLNPDLCRFWRHARDDSDGLAAAVERIKHDALDGRRLYTELAASYASDLTTFERAVRFFVLNRITFSGTIDSGGYSRQAFEARFTVSAIERLRAVHLILGGVRITDLDYRDVLADAPPSAFVFLDPPYLGTTKSKLYGRRGELHTAFDHQVFAERLKTCRCRWLLTLDDSPETRRLFAFANVSGWQLEYGMNNYRRSSAPKGSELFVSNYDLPIEASTMRGLLAR